ncbi:MAG: hypothetical protein HQL52_12260 [Magnetococcales bacterium]|nr:hypothetical protein [Magnetococcales bacterium]
MPSRKNQIFRKARVLLKVKQYLESIVPDTLDSRLRGNDEKRAMASVQFLIRMAIGALHLTRHPREGGDPGRASWPSRKSQTFRKASVFLKVMQDLERVVPGLLDFRIYGNDGKSATAYVQFLIGIAILLIHGVISTCDINEWKKKRRPEGRRR